MSLAETGPREGPAPSLGRRAGTDLLVFLAFAALTVAMTWPWARDIRFAVPDEGDPYLSAFILWWDVHALFHAPLSLFHPPLFFPLKYALAFSEHDVGLALLAAPLFALGATPVAAHGAVQLFSYAFCGYGAYRLARTTTGSTAAAWICGIGFAFVPYRFHQISHVGYTAAGWIPLLLEAVVLFVRRRSWPRAGWLGVAFFANGLTCIHWMVLPAIPLALVGGVLALRNGATRERDFWLRGGAALLGASLLLLPFLIPYRTAARLYGFERTADEARDYSAWLVDWVTSTDFNKLWKGLGPWPPHGRLFPGLLLPLLSAAALLSLRRRRGGSEAEPALPGETRPLSTARRRLFRFLDFGAIVTAALVLAIDVSGGLRIRSGGRVVVKADDDTRAFLLLALFLLVRWLLAWPGWTRRLGCRRPNLVESLRSSSAPEWAVSGVVFTVTGFLGSFGMYLPFHRALFEFVPVFRSIRVPERWAMVACLGLALLAGAGAAALGRALAKRAGTPGAAGALAFVLALLLAFELRVAPLDLKRGEPDPDGVSRFLTSAPARGGIVELPSETFPVSYRAVLRVADHGKPLVSAVSGFIPPHVARLAELQRERPIPDALLDHLEGIPVSWVVFRAADVPKEDLAAWTGFFRRASASGRLKLCGRFDSRGDEAWAVTKTEPQAPVEPRAPAAAGSVPGR